MSDSSVLQDITYHYNCSNASHLCWRRSIRLAWCGSVTTVDPRGHSKKFWWPHYCTATATASSGEFSLSELSLSLIHYVKCSCLFQCLLSAFRFLIWLQCSPTGAQLLRFAMPQHYGVYPWQAYVPPGDDLWPMSGMHWVAATSTALSSGVLHTNHLAVFKPFHVYGGAYSSGGLAESHFASAFPTWWGGVFFSRLCSTQYHL